jgi:hypothetical protein
LLNSSAFFLGAPFTALPFSTKLSSDVVEQKNRTNTKLDSETGLRENLMESRQFCGLSAWKEE